uniref:propanoyl-CoA C-acyltransferase n=2 Tax=Macrostomum lignano TaxID=282301 RepID=A0A1I8JJG4_9PLAT
MTQQPRILITGAGMTRFTRPQASPNDSLGYEFDQLAEQAAAEALRDSGIEYSSVVAVVASYCYGDPACGQRVAYRLGLTGVPVFNVNNNCSSGSSAIALSRAILIANSTIGANPGPVLVLGFEQMERGGLSRRYPDRPDPVGRHCDRIGALGGNREPCSPGMSQWTSDVIRMFAGAASEYRDISGSAALTSEQLLASVAFKSRLHGSQNPRAMLSRAPKSADDLLKAPLLSPPIRVSFCAPVATGAAAVVMATESWWSNRRLPVTELVDQELVSDFSDTFSDTNSGGYSSLCGLTQARVASSRIYHRQRLNPREQLALVELHDCFASNELMLYEALGLADKGCAQQYFSSGRWIDSLNGDGSLYLTGRQVVNPSGGLMSKGHPLGASGVAQCAEISWQHRGLAGRRQVPALDETDSNRWALQHNFGLGSSCAVTLYRRYGSGVLERGQGAKL